MAFFELTLRVLVMFLGKIFYDYYQITNFLSRLKQLIPIKSFKSPLFRDSRQ